MNKPDEIVNRVAQSGICSIDIEELIPERKEMFIDIKEQLFQGLIIKERDFRDWIKTNDWSIYDGAYVAIYCSADAIVPTWAYMLISSALEPYTKDSYFCNPDNLSALVVERYLTLLDLSTFADARVVIKGCGHRKISNHAYVKLTTMLVPITKSLMFGEPCSTVPVFKRK